MPAVFDASALLALVLHEPSGDLVAEVLDEGVASSLIACEVQTRLVDRGMPAREAERTLDDLDLDVSSFTNRDAAAAAALGLATRRAGLSLADRACLVLGRARALPIYTADRAWAELGLDIRLIR